MLYCATDEIGMSEQDVGNAAAILQDIDRFPSLVDRSQQGILNSLFLGRLLLTADGFSSSSAFRQGGASEIDRSHLYYDGNSQGGVMGGAVVAVSTDIAAGVLGVTGMDYATLVERSVDFDPFFAIMRTSYPRRLDQVLGLQIIQMMWDRGEADGYAANLTDHPLPGTPAHRVLMHVALGDHQVSTVTAEVEARTAGIPVHRPLYAVGRSFEAEQGWGLDTLTDGATGSGLVVWDSGSPLPPVGNQPPRAGHDPHEDPRRSPLAQAQKDAFLRPGGTIPDECPSVACTAPPT